MHPTATLPGETEIENRYLRYFHHETTSGFQSAWDWTLWNRVILQGSHHEPFIRYAVVAIGALHKSLRTMSSTGKEACNKIDPMAKLHREFAYLTYGKALKKMQAAIDGDSGPRYALLACLLIVCFESHTGDRYQALMHAKYGLQILDQWRSQQRPKNIEKPSSESPSPTDVEDDIVVAFKNLDIQIVTVIDARTTKQHEVLMEEDSSVVMSMPDQFEHLDEAKNLWNVIMRRTCHFLATTWPRTESSSLTREFSMKIPGSVLTSVGNTIHTTANKVDETVRMGERRFSADIARWLKSFEAICFRIRRSGNASIREYVIATMLQVQALNAKITLAAVAFTKEISYDQFLPEFSTIVRLAKEVATICNSASDRDFWVGSFTLDLGLIVPLFLVLLRCRNCVLRREALEILRSWHVEGWWDPLLIIAIGQFIIDVEEEGMVDGFIPDSARAILTAKSHCPPQRVALVQCVQRADVAVSGWKWTERLVKW